MILAPGYLHGQFGTFYNLLMYAEIIAWLLIMLYGTKWNNLNWLFAVVIAFSYVHAMLLPMLAAIAYTILTYLVGHYFVSRSEHGIDKDNRLSSYFIGMMVLTILYALMSLLKIGSIRNIRIVDGVLLLALGIWYVKGNKGFLDNWKKSSFVSKKVYTQAAVVCCFVFLMIGRANASIDVDSAWYGLRSAFVLDNKTGIYDDLKLVGCVYTYPKGYEIYQLPFSGLSSFGYVYAGNILMVIAILYVVYRISHIFLKQEQAMWCVVLVSAIPGIMNMGTTAKPDVMTLLIQMLQIYYSIQLIKKRHNSYLGLVGATYIYAQSLKPTAAIFSTTILLAFVFVLIVYRIWVKFRGRDAVLWLLAGIDLAFIWLRTYLLIGIPATSIWGRLFRAMGMTEKYPYASGQISQFRVESLIDPDVIHGSLDRIRQFLFAPNSQDTDHIILAWGSTLCTFLLIIALLGMLVNIKDTLRILRNNAIAGFLGLLMVGEFVGCLLCLWTLSKPDGNYFMLYYCVTVVVAVIYIQYVLVRRRILLSKVVIVGFIAFLPANLVISGCTNWAWAASFAKPDLINRGYANHMQDTRRTWKKKGCEQLYDIMTASKHNKVLGYATHPDVELIPCVMESEQDVSFWGNAALTATTENFREFVEYENYDYIFISNEYITPESGAYSYMDDLIDAGMVKNVVTENGFVLLEMGTPDAPHSKEEMKQQYHSVWEEEPEE